ncbi:MAG: diguanylate cyclase, partial [Anaerolineales bacterium]|nr:diguanylate cyclase [Anaerolineales bacterium]
MLWQANPYSAPLFGAAVTGLAILLLASRRHQAPGAPALAALGLGIAIWCAAYGLVWGASAPAVGQLAHRAATLGSTIVPAAFLYFTVRIGRRVVRWLGQLRAGLLGLGALQILIAWSNPFSLWYAAEAMQTVSGLPIAAFQPGPAYWLFNVVYSYGLILSGTVVLGLEFWNARGIYRAQYGWTLVGVALSFAASVVTELGLTPWPGLDLAPISMALSGLLFTYALFRYRLLDLVPVARTTLVDNMPDALIALDPQQRVVDINPAALRLLGWAGPLPLGQPWERVCAVWPDLAGRYAAVYETQAEEQPALGLTLDLRITPLPDPAGEARGRLIVLRDITDLKRAEQELQTANRQLRDQLAQIRDLQDQLREQAVRDPLTGLYNRRYLEETLPREAARAAREREPLSLIFIDIDRFKGVNDVFGHAAGDRVLQALGTFLVSHTRGVDIVCRYGGEE